MTFVTKYGDRATGVYLEASTSGAEMQLDGHRVLSDDCFGPDHNIGPVQCWMHTAPAPLAGAEAERVKARLKKVLS